MVGCSCRSCWVIRSVKFYFSLFIYLTFPNGSEIVWIYAKRLASSSVFGFCPSPRCWPNERTGRGMTYAPYIRDNVTDCRWQWERQRNFSCAVIIARKFYLLWFPFAGKHNTDTILRSTHSLTGCFMPVTTMMDNIMACNQQYPARREGRFVPFSSLFSCLTRSCGGG